MGRTTCGQRGPSPGLEMHIGQPKISTVELASSGLAWLNGEVANAAAGADQEMGLMMLGNRIRRAWRKLNAYS